MSLNKSLNAAIALIEGRPKAARDILRDPSSDITDVSKVIVRLYNSLDYCVCSVLKEVLMSCLHLQPPESMNASEKEAFYKGINSVEAILENIVSLKGGRNEEVHPKE